MGQANSKPSLQSYISATNAANGNTAETAVGMQEDNRRNSRVTYSDNNSMNMYERSQLESISTILNPSSSQHVESGTSSSDVPADPASISWVITLLSHNQDPHQPASIMNFTTETAETAVSMQVDNRRNLRVTYSDNNRMNMYERSQLESNSTILNLSSSQHVESGTSSSHVPGDPASIRLLRTPISHNQDPHQPTPIMNDSTENHSEQVTNTDQDNQDVLNLSNQAISNYSDRSNQCNLDKDKRTDATDNNKNGKRKRLAYLIPLNEEDDIGSDSDVEDFTVESLNNDNEEETQFCSVCLDSCRDIFSKGADIVTLGCKHKFCYVCFDKFSSSNKCPICRALISKHKRRSFFILKF